jgi:hypothetical protein
LVPVTEYGMGGYLVLVTGSLQLSTAGGTASIQLVAGNATGGGLSDAIRQVVAFPAMASAPVVPFSAFMFIGVNAVTGNNLIAKLRYGNGTGPVTLFGNSTVISLVRLTGG